MGTIVNEFVCVEVEISYEKGIELEMLIATCSWKDCFNVTMGNNGYVFFTAAPSGSKEGWTANKQHQEELNMLLSWLKENSSFYVEKRLITSGG